jgi:hypothetical protein
MNTLSLAKPAVIPFLCGLIAAVIGSRASYTNGLAAVFAIALQVVAPAGCGGRTSDSDAGDHVEPESSDGAGTDAPDGRSPDATKPDGKAMECLYDASASGCASGSPIPGCWACPSTKYPACPAGWGPMTLERCISGTVIGWSCLSCSEGVATLNVCGSGGVEHSATTWSCSN